MDRLETVREYVNDILTNHCLLPDTIEITAHLYGVSSACVLLAIKRGLDMEIAAVCGLMHDLYSCYTGRYTLHGPSGAEMARVALRRMDCFSEEERLIIQSAIFHHGDKPHLHDPYDELLKDADTLYPFLRECGHVPSRVREMRIRRLALELDIPFSPRLPDRTDGGPPASFDKNKLAGIAEQLAARNIVGNKDNEDFQSILRYWPEPEALDELKNGWCAAFVYHCCMLSGIELPIRYPGVGARFAGVGAWLEWAQRNGFYYGGLAGFVPVRGDIVIYDNIIPAGRKEPDGRWHDHIGILLAVDGDSLTVAEGNVDNGNVSGVTRRNMHVNIGGFIRIPEPYEYDGWKYDYKTKRVRTEPFVI